MKTSHKSQKQQSRNRINNSKKLLKSKLYKKIQKTKKLGNNLTKKTIKKKIKPIKQTKQIKGVKQIGGTFKTLENGDIVSRQFLSFQVPKEQIASPSQDHVYEVRPYPLSAMILQDLCNRNKIKFESFTNRKKKIVLGAFIKNDTPSLVVKKIQITLPNEKKCLPRHNKFVRVREEPSVQNSTITGQILRIPVKESKTGELLKISSDISYAQQLLNYLNGNAAASNDLKYGSFNIYSDMKMTDNNGDSVDVKIIGYPDPKHMMPVLDNSGFMANYNELAKKQREEYLEWMISLFNDGEQQTPQNQDPLNISNGIIREDASDSYKLIMCDFVDFQNYLSGFIPDDREKQTTIAREYYERLQAIMERKRLFNRPNCRIKYQFLVFKKGADGKYDFLIKNVRELKQEHTEVLRKILYLIQTEIPRMFGLLLDGETRHENFYSYTELGKLFSIVAEFLHPTTRFETFSYLYKQQITLEELIYSAGLTVTNQSNSDVPFWSMKKFEYPIKNFNLSELTSEKPVEMVMKCEYDAQVDEAKVFEDGVDEAEDDDEDGVDGDEAEDDEADEAVKKKNSDNPIKVGGNGTDISLAIPDLGNATILLCNLLSSFDTEIIYKNRIGEFWYLVLEANIGNVYRNKAQVVRSIPIPDTAVTHSVAYSSPKVTMHIIPYSSYTYVVKEHKRITSNFFKGSSYYISAFPVIRHTKIYDYPYQDEYPKKIAPIFQKGKQLLEESSVPKPVTVNVSLPNGKTVAVLKNRSVVASKQQQYDVFKCGNYVFIHVETEGKNNSTLWILDESKRRIKSIFDIVDNQLLALALDIVQSQLQELVGERVFFIHAYSGFTLAQLHCKVVKQKFYDSPTYAHEISQSTETRSLLLKNVIYNMDLKDDYYSEFKNSEINMPFFTRYGLQFIPPL
jgi:hypothetical protein